MQAPLEDKRALPSPGELHLWRLPHRVLPAERVCLSPAEQGRLTSYRFKKDRDRYCFTRTRTREILASYLSQPPQRIEFAIGQYGKPGVAGLEFSLSHSDGLSLLAITPNGRIGIDYETTAGQKLDHALAERILTPREQRSLEALTGPDLTFALLRIWTAKEAYLKALGTGLAIEPRRVESSYPELHHISHEGHPPFLLKKLEVACGVAHLATERTVRIIEQEDCL